MGVAADTWDSAVARTVACPDCSSSLCCWCCGGACPSCLRCGSAVGVPMIVSTSVERTFETCRCPIRKCSRKWNRGRCGCAGLDVEPWSLVRGSVVGRGEHERREMGLWCDRLERWWGREGECDWLELCARWGVSPWRLVVSPVMAGVGMRVAVSPVAGAGSAGVGLGASARGM